MKKTRLFKITKLSFKKSFDYLKNTEETNKILNLFFKSKNAKENSNFPAFR